MYIVKACSKSKGGLLSPKDGYVEIETEEKAIELYEDIVNRYPFGIEVKIFETKEVSPPKHILENAIKNKEKDMLVQKMMIERGLDFYSVVSHNGFTKDYCAE